MNTRENKTEPSVYLPLNKNTGELAVRESENLKALIAENIVSPEEDVKRPELQASLSPIPIQGDQVIQLMYNGPELNKVIGTSLVHNDFYIDKELDQAVVKKGSFSMVLKNYSKLKGSVKDSTWKLLDVCTLWITRNNHYLGPKHKEKDFNASSLNTIGQISIDDYMTFLDIPKTASSRKKALKTLKNDLDILQELECFWQKDSEAEPVRMRFVSGRDPCNGTYVVEFPKMLVAYLVTSFPMEYDTRILALSGRNPNVFALARKLNEHTSINKDVQNERESLISVKSLLEVCDAIPTYDEVKAGNRAYTDRIINPLKKALDLMKESGLINWRWANSKGKPLTAKQTSAADYNTLISLYVSYFWIGRAPENEKAGT